MNPISTATPPLLLASGSPYRKQLLAKLGLEFDTASPDVDENQLFAESPAQMASRLSYAKCRALTSRHPDHLIIGSDQVATVDDHILSKPGSIESACQQLQFCSGKTVSFLTGLTVLEANSGIYYSHVEPFEVKFRELSQSQIENYVRKEQPLDCAGSFKAEGLGIALFTALSGRDPNALIGLPLIALVDLLAKFKISIL